MSDSEFFAAGVPSITYALRGIVYLEVSLRGGAADAHSGLHGGALGNPIHVLAKLIAAMHDEAGRVTIPGYYDNVLPLAESERDAWANLPFDEAGYAASLGVDTLAGGEKGYSVLERIWARPTLDCCSIVGGFTAPGAKTIIPAEASAKVSMRLVAEQDPERVAAALERFVADHTPDGFTATVKRHALARPLLLTTDSPAMEAARAAL